jgi:hypothetical protein
VYLIGVKPAAILASNVKFTPHGVTSDLLLAAKREGYDLARNGASVTVPAPTATVTWPARP